MGGIRQLRLGHSGCTDKFRRLAIAQSDGAGFIEKQGVDIAGRLDGASRHGQDIVLHQAVHAGDSDGGKQSTDGGRNQADQQRDQNENRLRRSGIDGEGLQRDHGQQKNNRQAREQDIEGDFVRRLLPLGAFDQRDHAIKESFPGIGSDFDLDAVGEHARASGDGGAVASCLANHGRGFTRDGGLVYRGNAFDDLAVARE